MLQNIFWQKAQFSEGSGSVDSLANKRCYAAVDIGASSGRVLVGYLEAGKICLEEVHRFDNAQRRVNGHDCWDVEKLFNEVVAGLAAVRDKTGATPVSVGIDTWGVDFVLLDENDQLVGDAVAYRDARTDDILPQLDQIILPSELYARTGIQRQSFNTICQLVALKNEHPEQLERAKSFLLIPDYLHWRLTGVKAIEYTNASTTGLLDAQACDWDEEILRKIGVSPELFSTPVIPGSSLGHLLPEIAERVGYDAEVILPATHDTGSAFLAVPATDQSVFISSGTWSLLGVENPSPVATPEAREQNFTNEGGYQRRYRFLKNIMGLWMSQSVRREANGVDYVEGKTSHVRMADHDLGFGELIDMARAAEPFSAIVDVDDPRFLAPDSMIEEIRAACRESGQPVPEDLGQVMRVVYCSLVDDYARAAKGLEELTLRTYSQVNIVGGGCQDDYLNQMTADACGLPVVAGPVEGTSLGNLMVQMIEDGAFKDLAEARSCVASSFGVKRFEPRG